MSSSSSTRSGRTRLGLLSIAVALAAVAAACQVPTTPTTTTSTSTTTTSTSTTTTAPAVPAITVTPQPTDVTPGSTVTVTGTGYDADGYIGTRPPFSGQPAGVYVVFARLGDPWRPSQSAPSSSRQVISQVWALPQAQHDALDPDGSNPAIVLMAPDGSFTADLALNEATGTGAYNVATYPASGAVNATAEVAVPVTFAAVPE